MKTRMSSVLLLIVLFVSFAMMAFAPMVTVRAQEGGVDLSESQLVMVGLIASALTWVLKILVSRGYQPKKEHVAIGLYVVSFFASVGFTPVVIPPFPPFSDAPSFVGALLGYIGQLLAVASPIAGMAFLIYNLLLQRVLDKMFPTLKG